MKRLPKLLCSLAAAGAVAFAALPLTACSKGGNELVLRVSNWEEYIDDGIVDEFTEWFNDNHDYVISVEYSTFGTNEDLYNRLNLGDTYDLVCPSDYMIMQLMREGKLVEYSDDFLNNTDEEYNYIRNVSTFISDKFNEFGGQNYAAGYMWGTTGIVYNPELVDVEDVSTWDILRNEKYARQITIKDNVRDSYFPALAILNSEDLVAGNCDPDEVLNDTKDETIAAALQILKEIKENVYSFETDSGKADMITGKVVANYQWSGDAVFIMDSADDDAGNPTELWYSVPDECTNLWFDGWVMLKDGINGDERKQIAAEAFVNFLSKPENAIRNMDCIGYTSAIAGKEVYDYLKENYGVEVEEDDETEIETYDYDVSNFFGEGYKPLTVDKSTLEIGEDGAINRGRQLFAQYPPENITARSVIMEDFGDRLSAINQMWIDVRCLDVKDFNPAVVWSVVAIIVVGAAAIVLYKFRYQIFYRSPKELEK